MSSNESEAYKIMTNLDVDYVLVIFGGVIGYSGDDINKFLWMVRIAEGEHPKDIQVIFSVWSSKLCPIITFFSFLIKGKQLLQRARWIPCRLWSFPNYVKLLDVQTFLLSIRWYEGNNQIEGPSIILLLYSYHVVKLFSWTSATLPDSTELVMQLLDSAQLT